LPAINPCGTVVGTTRVSYFTRVNFFRDNPDLWTDIVVYPAQIGAKTLPFATIFGPNVWLWGRSIPLPGFDLDEHSYYNGQDKWHCDGQEFLGDEQQWREGCLTTDPVPEYNPLTLCPAKCNCGPAIIDSCPSCPDGSYDTYKVTFSGAIGAAAFWNGTWDLPYNPSGTIPCRWRYDGPEQLDLIFPDALAITLIGNLPDVWSYRLDKEPGCLEEEYVLNLQFDASGLMPATAKVHI